ncbi:MAG: Fe-S-containing hydro-lyase [Anaerolineae bacterium]
MPRSWRWSWLSGQIHNIAAPLTEEVILQLRAGDQVRISGTVYVARDAAHKRMVEALQRGEPLPFDLRGQIVYYMGPTPAKPGKAIGAAGPTTSGRMDPYTPVLLEAGLKGMIGKGKRSPSVREALCKYKAVYFAVPGGVAALLAGTVKRAELVAYEDLGPEAVLRLELGGLPAIVANDAHGGDAYEKGKAAYRRQSA